MSRFVFYDTPRAVLTAAAPLYADLAALKMRLALVRLARKYHFNPAQPRVPAGNADGGQWTDLGGEARLAGGAEDDEPHRTGRSAIIENPMAALRQAAFANNMRTLRRLDPAHPQLSYVAGPDFIPRQEQVDALRDEVEAARDAVSQKIAAGHGFKHAGEVGASTRDEFAVIVRQTMASPFSQVKELSGGRTLFYNARNNIVVFVNPADQDRGTMFKPLKGQAYVDRQE